MNERTNELNNEFITLPLIEGISKAINDIAYWDTRIRITNVSLKD